MIQKIIVEAIGFLGAIFEILGVYLLGNKIKYGFISNIIGGALWVLYSILARSAFGLIAVCVVTIILNSRGFIKWIREDRNG